MRGEEGGGGSSDPDGLPVVCHPAVHHKPEKQNVF